MNNKLRMTCCLILAGVLMPSGVIPGVWAASEDVAASIRELNRTGEWEAARTILNDIKEDAPWVTLLHAETDWYAGNFSAARNTIQDIPESERAVWIHAHQSAKW